MQYLTALRLDMKPNMKTVVRGRQGGKTRLFAFAHVFLVEANHRRGGEGLFCVCVCV